jgi:hypothetical protein
VSAPVGSPGEWSEPRLVDKTAPPPIVLGEMAEVRRREREARRALRGRRIWPLFVALLVVVIGTCVVLLVVGLRF